jgi:hypothetical protein
VSRPASFRAIGRVPRGLGSKVRSASSAHPRPILLLLRAATLLKMGQLSQKSGRNDEAVRLMTESAAVFRSGGDRNQEAGALTALAKAERARGNIGPALSSVEESLRIAELLRAESVSPESRTAFLAGVQDSYQVYTDLLMLRHRAEPEKGFDAVAVEVSERQRARSLLDTLVEARADLGKGVDPALIERERSLARQLNEKAGTRPGTPEQAAALQREITRLEIDHERAQVDIWKADPHYAALTHPQPPTPMFARVRCQRLVRAGNDERDRDDAELDPLRRAAVRDPRARACE